MVVQHPASAPRKAVSVDGKVVALWHPLMTEGMEFWFGMLGRGRQWKAMGGRGSEWIARMGRGVLRSIGNL